MAIIIGRYRIIIHVFLLVTIASFVAFTVLYSDRHIANQKPHRPTCTEELCYKDYPPGYFRTIPPEMDNVIWVRASGDYFKRLSVYNRALTSLRGDTIPQVQNVTWQPLAKQIQSVWTLDTSAYLDTTSRHRTVINLALALDRTHVDENASIWNSDQDTANLVIQKYHHWTASKPLCSWLTSNTTDIKDYAWGALFRKKCYTDLSVGLNRTKLEPLYLNARRPASQSFWPKKIGGFYPPELYFTLVNFVHHIQIIRYGLVDTIGDVYTGALKLVQFSCSNANPQGVLTNTIKAPESSSKLYEEVFVISQLYNSVLYHSTIEDLPRAVPYLEFLTNHTSIKIHTGKVHNAFATMFEMLGITRDRFVQGPIRAKIVYIPQFTPCGLNQVQALQLASHLYRQHLAQKYPDDKRNSILLIRRRGRRRFKHHDQIYNGLQRIANETNLTLEVLDDHHIPTIYDVYRMFKRAVVVVGPHGAGLLNMVFSEPGTLVVEGVCHGGAMVLYYLWEAHTLGHHWHGIPGQTDACDAYIDSSPDEIFRVVKHFLINR